MGIKHQLQDEKHPYASPSTPGLYVTFRNYIIELVCLNINPKIGPRFWSDPKYWGSKYKREVRGISNLGKELDLSDVLTQTALVQIIKEHSIKALVAKKTIIKIVRLTHHRVAQLKNKREILIAKESQPIIDEKKNATFVDTGEKSTLTKIKELENG